MDRTRKKYMDMILNDTYYTFCLTHKKHHDNSNNPNSNMGTYIPIQNLSA